jgi:hypothetical protein
MSGLKRLANIPVHGGFMPLCKGNGSSKLVGIDRGGSC